MVDTHMNERKSKYQEKYGDYAIPLVFRGVLFFQTCMACPEQYDVWYEDKPVGYVRLRWGFLRCDYPDVGGETIYEAIISDDGYQGCFSDDEQRCYHLCAIAEKVKKKYSLDSIG